MMEFVKCLAILLLCALVVTADKYHPRADKIDNSRKVSAAGDRPELGQGLHKIPYTSWKNVAKTSLDQRLAEIVNQNKAKNIIFFIGDGMGISTLSAARIHKSQKDGITMDKVKLAWDEFTYSGIVRTYNSDASVADSAGTATAFMCGEKARLGVIGMTDIVEYGGNCSDYTSAQDCKSSVHHAMEAGKWAGVVSTSTITDATPACAYAHSPHRYWQSDVGIPENLRSHCEDIAHQLIYKQQNQDIRVVLGGGRQNFMTTSEQDPEGSVNGNREDLNLINEWLRIKGESGLSANEYAYVDDKSGFESANPDQVKYLFGLFEPDTMQYEADRDTSASGEPSLAEMTEKSINMLEKSPNGFHLYVEGGRIDHAHHDTNAQRAMIETWALSDAVQKAIDMTNPEETLIVVTADHSHTFTLNGYSHIDSELYGIGYTTKGAMQTGSDGLPYTMISYANGQGYDNHQGTTAGTRKDLEYQTPAEFNDINYRQPTMMRKSSETHGGEDVGVFASGPWAHLFSGTVEQNYLAVAMMHAACIGPDAPAQHCDGSTGTGGGSMVKATMLIPIVLILRTLFN